MTDTTQNSYAMAAALVRAVAMARPHPMLVDGQWTEAAKAHAAAVMALIDSLCTPSESYARYRLMDEARIFQSLAVAATEARAEYFASCEAAGEKHPEAL